MQIAVSGVKHVGNAQLIGICEPRDFRQDFSKSAARDGAVYTVVIRREPANRWKGILAPGPEAHAFFFIARDCNRARPAVVQDSRYGFDIGINFLYPAIQFAQQNRRGITRIAGMHKILCRNNCRVIHHFETTRDNSGGNNLCNAVRRAFNRRK